MQCGSTTYAYILKRGCDMMDQKEEYKSIPSKKNMMDNKKKTWEFDEAREPLILIRGGHKTSTFLL